MSKTAFKRDIDDPQTIADFAAQVQSLERLRLLLVLTVADIRAVGPKTWNGWKAQLLRDLYHRAEEQLSGGLIAEGREARAAAATAALRAELADWNAEDIDTHLARGTASYWLSFDTATLARHARLVRTAEAREQRRCRSRPASIAGARSPRSRSTPPDRHGLFSAARRRPRRRRRQHRRRPHLHPDQRHGARHLLGAGRRGRPVRAPRQLARLSVIVEQTLGGRPLPDLDQRFQAYKSRIDVFPVAPRVLIDNNASATHTVIEVNGRDRPGLLYRLTRALTELKLQISSAKISTFGERAVDVFYVKDLFGLKIAAEPRLKSIRARLLQALEPTPVRRARHRRSDRDRSRPVGAAGVELRATSRPHR